MAKEEDCHHDQYSSHQELSSVHNMGAIQYICVEVLDQGYLYAPTLRNVCLCLTVKAQIIIYLTWCGDHCVENIQKKVREYNFPLRIYWKVTQQLTDTHNTQLMFL